AAAFGDFDNDGTCDIAVIHQEQSMALLKNLGCPGNHALGLELVGRCSNRGAVGARVTAELGGRRLVREITGGGSYLAASDRRLLIGLGTQRRVERLAIRWPSGREETFTDLEADQYLRIVEGPGVIAHKQPFQTHQPK